MGGRERRREGGQVGGRERRREGGIHRMKDDV